MTSICFPSGPGICHHRFLLIRSYLKLPKLNAHKQQHICIGLSEGGSACTSSNCCAQHRLPNLCPEEVPPRSAHLPGYVQWASSKASGMKGTPFLLPITAAPQQEGGRPRHFITFMRNTSCITRTAKLSPGQAAAIAPQQFLGLWSCSW